MWQPSRPGRQSGAAARLRDAKIQPGHPGSGAWRCAKCTMVAPGPMALSTGYCELPMGPATTAEDQPPGGGSSAPTYASAVTGSASQIESCVAVLATGTSRRSAAWTRNTAAGIASAWPSAGCATALRRGNRSPSFRVPSVQSARRIRALVPSILTTTMRRAPCEASYAPPAMSGWGCSGSPESCCLPLQATCQTTKEPMTTRWKGSTRKQTLPVDWERIRRVVLERCAYRCEWVENDARCYSKATDVDHKGDRLDHSVESLQGLCNPHHLVKTGRDARARQLRFQSLKRLPLEKQPGVIDGPPTPTQHRGF
jgi:5-methylcytosine-specific restriction enzyme A